MLVPIGRPPIDVSIQSSINLGQKRFESDTRMKNHTDLNLGDFFFIYQSFFISQILDLIYGMVTIFIFDCVTVQTCN